jgi:hypothetical protein
MPLNNTRNFICGKRGVFSVLKIKYNFQNRNTIITGIIMTAIPNRKLKVFLCHSSEDKPAVRELYARLNAEGWIDPWLDEEKLYPGQDWDREIEMGNKT